MSYVRKNIFLLFGLFVVIQLFLLSTNRDMVDATAFKIPAVCTLAHHSDVVVLTEGHSRKEHLPINKHKHQSSNHKTIDVKMASAVDAHLNSYFDAALAPTAALPPTYGYLFFSEINPPPPKLS